MQQKIQKNSIIIIIIDFLMDYLTNNQKNQLINQMNSINKFQNYNKNSKNSIIIIVIDYLIDCLTLSFNPINQSN